MITAHTAGLRALTRAGTEHNGLPTGQHTNPKLETTENEQMTTSMIKPYQIYLVQLASGPLITMSGEHLITAIRDGLNVKSWTARRNDHDSKIP